MKCNDTFERRLKRSNTAYSASVLRTRLNLSSRSYARFGRSWTASASVTRALGTKNRAAAKVKMERMIAEAEVLAAAGGTTRKALSASAKRGETFEQAARRVHKLRRAVIKPENADAGLALLARHAFEIIGASPVAAVLTARRQQCARRCSRERHRSRQRRPHPPAQRGLGAALPRGCDRREPGRGRDHARLLRAT